MDEDEKILIQMQKSLGRLEGTVNAFLQETRSRLEKLEHLNQVSGRNARIEIISALGCLAAVVSTGITLLRLR